MSHNCLTACLYLHHYTLLILSRWCHRLLLTRHALDCNYLPFELCEFFSDAVQCQSEVGNGRRQLKTFLQLIRSWLHSRHLAINVLVCSTKFLVQKFIRNLRMHINNVQRILKIQSPVYPTICYSYRSCSPQLGCAHAQPKRGATNRLWRSHHFWRK